MTTTIGIDNHSIDKISQEISNESSRSDSLEIDENEGEKNTITQLYQTNDKKREKEQPMKLAKSPIIVLLQSGDRGETNDYPESIQQRMNPSFCFSFFFFQMSTTIRNNEMKQIKSKSNE